MPYTQTHLETLQQVLAKGEKRVTFGDKTVEYRSIEELQAAIRAVESDLLRQKTVAGEARPTVRQIRINTSKGF